MISFLISSLITSASLFYSDSFLYSKFNCSSIHIQLYFSSRMHTHVYTYIHTYIHRLTYTHAQTHTDINTDTHPHPHPHTCTQSSGGIESILRSRGSSIPGPRPCPSSCPCSDNSVILSVSLIWLSLLPILSLSVLQKGDL